MNEKNLQYNEEQLDSPETLANVEEMIKAAVGERADYTTHLNRAQRRALMKKGGKTGRRQLSVINETAQKLNYIDLIQELRKLNEEKEKEDNEATQD